MDEGGDGGQGTLFQSLLAIFLSGKGGLHGLGQKRLQKATEFGLGIIKGCVTNAIDGRKILELSDQDGMKSTQKDKHTWHRTQ